MSFVNQKSSNSRMPGGLNHGWLLDLRRDSRLEYPQRRRNNAHHMAQDSKLNLLPHWLRTLIFGRNPAWTIVRLALLIGGVLVVFNYVLTRPIRITGRSMEPTFHDGQVNILNRLAYLYHEPQRGDIVGVRYSGEHMLLLKRIVGLPGESISFEDGKLLINGEPLDEPYVKRKCSWTHPALTLRPNEYYVVGDNRSMAWDDHDHGATERKRIIGKVVFGGNQ